MEIVITNWENYLKLWKIKLFDSCKRKRDKFEKICQNLNVHLNFNKEFREEFFRSLNMYQKGIAKVIGSWQANVSRTIDGNHLLKIEQLSKLLKHSNFNKKDISNNVEYFRVGSLTKLEPNDDMFKFSREFKSF